MLDEGFVNAHINNISFPKTIDQLESFIYDHGCYNVEDIVNESKGGYTVWTVPRSSVVGDIVLYFHAKTAIQWIRKLETKTRSLNTEEHDIDTLMDWLQRARRLYSVYGGKIFAIGKVSSRPEQDGGYENSYHWSGRIYAEVNQLHVLDVPIDISEFKSFILVSRQSAITPLPSNEYERLKDIIISKNPNVPVYFKTSHVGDYRLSEINASNFLTLTKPYRERFLLESNFRSYYVDYFLKAIAGKKCYRECQCHTANHPLARVDNVFDLDGKKILFEVKLNIALENDLPSQLNQYIDADYIYLTEQKRERLYTFEKKYMLVIDVFSLYQYTAKDRKLVKLFDLDELDSIGDIVNRVKDVCR